MPNGRALPQTTEALILREPCLSALGITIGTFNRTSFVALIPYEFQLRCQIRYHLPWTKSATDWKGLPLKHQAALTCSLVPHRRALGTPFGTLNYIGIEYELLNSLVKSFHYLLDYFSFPVFLFLPMCLFFLGWKVSLLRKRRHPP